MTAKFFWMFSPKGVFGGEASETGFCVKRGRSIIAATRNYKKIDILPPFVSSRIRTRALVATVILMAAPCASMLLLDMPLLLFLVISFLFGMPLFSMCGLAFYWIEIKKLFPTIAMYHAAEHKAVYILEHNLEPSYENFKRAPKALVRCGTSTNFLWDFELMWIAAAIALSYFGHPIVLFVFTGLLVCRLTALFVSFMPSRFSAILILCVVISLPLTLHSWIFEHVFALKEPTAEIIIESIELVEKFRTPPNV